MKENREYDVSEQDDSDRLYSLEELMLAQELEDDNVDERKLSEDEREGFLRDLLTGFLTEDERKELEKLPEGCNMEMKEREYLSKPKETFREVLNEVMGTGLGEELDKKSIGEIQIENHFELGDWSSIGPVFMNEQMRRIHGIIERGYTTDNAGTSSRGWANQELITTLFEILGVSESTNSNILNSSEGMRKLKHSDSNPERVFIDNRFHL